MRARGEAGQALPLLLVVLLVATGAMLALGRLGVRAVAAAEARTAADAAALAAAAEGLAAADELARANGTTVEQASGGVGDATVTVGGFGAVARARAPEPSAGPGTDGLTPAMSAAIARAEALLGQPIPIVSGWRSAAQQADLWAHRHTNPYPVAPPGTSRHEQGLAIDVPLAFVSTLRGVAAVAGLCQPLPVSDPVHFELCG